MRLEIIIPDSTRPAVKSKLTSLLDQLSARPELVEEIHLNGDDEAEATAFFTPARIAEIREAQDEARTGNNITLDQYRAEAQQRRAAWQASHPA